MTLNMTQIAGMTQDQALLEFHKCISTPSLIILFIITFLALIITGAAMPYTKSKTTFFVILILSTLIVSLSALIFLTLLPNITQDIVSVFSKTC